LRSGIAGTGAAKDGRVGTRGAMCRTRQRLFPETWFHPGGERYVRDVSEVLRRVENDAPRANMFQTRFTLTLRESP